MFFFIITNNVANQNVLLPTHCSDSFVIKLICECKIQIAFNFGIWVKTSLYCENDVAEYLFWNNKWLIKITLRFGTNFYSFILMDWILIQLELRSEYEKSTLIFRIHFVIEFMSFFLSKLFCNIQQNKQLLRIVWFLVEKKYCEVNEHDVVLRKCILRDQLFGYQHWILNNWRPNKKRAKHVNLIESTISVGVCVFLRMLSKYMTRC